MSDRPVSVSLLSTSVWLSLPVPIRAKVAKLFELKKTGTPMTDIGPRGAEIISDGYRPQDLFPITIKRMQELLGTDNTDFYQLFDDVLGNLDALNAGEFLYPIHKPSKEEVEALKDSVDNSTIHMNVRKKRGRPKKHA